jgi:hypothetical protein
MFCAIATEPGTITKVEGFGFSFENLGFYRTLLPLSVRTQGIESLEQYATQGFDLVRQRNYF